MGMSWIARTVSSTSSCSESCKYVVICGLSRRRRARIAPMRAARDECLAAVNKPCSSAIQVSAIAPACRSKASASLFSTNMSKTSGTASVRPDLPSASAAKYLTRGASSRKHFRNESNALSDGASPRTLAVCARTSSLRLLIWATVHPVWHIIFLDLCYASHRHINQFSHTYVSCIFSNGSLHFLRTVAKIDQMNSCESMTWNVAPCGFTANERMPLNAVVPRKSARKKWPRYRSGRPTPG